MHGSKRAFALICSSLAALGVLSVLAAALVGMGLVPPTTAEAASLPDVFGKPAAVEAAGLPVQETSAEDKIASLASSAEALAWVVTTSPTMTPTAVKKFDGPVRVKTAPKRPVRTATRTRARAGSRPAARAGFNAASFIVHPARGRFRMARASWYGPGFYGRTMAGGGRLTRNSMIVAHKTLRFGTRVEISYNGRTVIAVVRDRGPFIAGREFDLGPGVAKALGFQGVHTIGVRILGR